MELQITLEDFKLIKQFYPEFSRKEGIKSNDFTIGWSELMPVVKKCEDISRQKQHDLDSPGKDLDDHNGWRAWSYHEPNLSTDLKSVYEQTVEFIRWYNSKNS